MGRDLTTCQGGRKAMHGNDHDLLLCLRAKTVTSRMKRKRWVNSLLMKGLFIVVAERNVTAGGAFS